MKGMFTYSMRRGPLMEGWTQIRRRRALARDHSGQPFALLHLPKTAGSFLKSSLRQEDVYMLPHTAAAEDTLSFSQGTSRILCIRNPLDWYTSLYNLKMAGGYDPQGKNYALMEKNSLQDFLEDVTFLKDGGRTLARWNKPWEHRVHMHRMQNAIATMQDRGAVGFWTLNILYYGCSRWRSVLQDRNVTRLIEREGAGLLDVEIVLRMERLAEDANDKIPKLVQHVDFSKRVNATPIDPMIGREMVSSAPRIAERDATMAHAMGYEV